MNKQAQRLSVTFMGVLFVTLLWTGVGYGVDAKRDTSDELFMPNVGFSSSAFTEVDKNDAKATTKLLGDMMVRKYQGQSFKNPGETFIYEHLSELENDLKAKKVDMVVLVADEFLEIRNRLPIEPIMVSSREKSVYEELFLLVRGDSGIKKGKDLRSKSIMVTKTQFGRVHLTWLETLLMKEGCYDISGIRETRKPSQAFMPVFFRQADACVVSRHYFEINSELNPQIERELMSISNSPGFAGGVIAFRKDYNERHKEIMKNILASLHADAHGRQMLLLFQIAKLVPFRPEYLNSTEALFKEHRDLKVRMVKVNQ
jgi:ABC-type phosphate/phosphonate transport system substrate-binding protein